MILEVSSFRVFNRAERWPGSKMSTVRKYGTLNFSANGHPGKFTAFEAEKLIGLKRKIIWTKTFIFEFQMWISRGVSAGTWTCPVWKRGKNITKQTINLLMPAVSYPGSKFQVDWHSGDSNPKKPNSASVSPLSGKSSKASGSDGWFLVR